MKPLACEHSRLGSLFFHSCSVGGQFVRQRRTALESRLSRLCTACLAGPMAPLIWMPPN